MVGLRKNGMNKKIDANELVIKNIHNYLKKKKIDYRISSLNFTNSFPKKKLIIHQYIILLQKLI